MHRGLQSAKVVLQRTTWLSVEKLPDATDCNPDLFGFARVEGREVVASFDGGAITTDAGALLLGGLTGRSGWSIGSLYASRTRARRS